MAQAAHSRRFQEVVGRELEDKIKKIEHLSSKELTRTLISTFPKPECDKGPDAT